MGSAILPQGKREQECGGFGVPADCAAISHRNR